MEKEVSCINSRYFLDYIKEHHNDDYPRLLENLAPEIDALPDTEGFLRDPNNWISCTVASKLYARARSILNDEMAAYKISMHAVKKTSLGYAQGIIVKAFWSTKMGLKNIQKVNDKFNRSKKAELVELRKNSAVVRLHWDRKMDLNRDFCLINQGVYTFMPLVWGGKPLHFVEKCCYFEGAPYCEYHLKWPARNRFHEIYSRFFTSKSVLSETINEMNEDKKIIERKYEEGNRLNVELNRKIRQLQATGKAILSILEIERLLAVIMNTLSSVCRIHRAIIMLVNEKKELLESIYAIGYDGHFQEEGRRFKVPLHQVDNILVRVTNTGKPEYIVDIRNSTLNKDLDIIGYGNPNSMYIVPLITRSKVIGVIITDAADGDEIPRGTRETLEIFAPQIAIAIENARLYKRLQGQMDELKKSHALLRRAEKFSFMGNLAARLAHEIKNPMTAIGTFIQMLPYNFEDEEYRNNFYSVALEETNRVNSLISELLDLVNTKESKIEKNDLHGLIDKMILLVSPQSNSKRIKIIRSFDPCIDQVWLDSEKIKQVILNLLANAIEFTPEEGKIEIITGVVDDSEKGKCIRIEVKDNGKGILPSVIDKVFDPYFTTKHKSDMHSGTGLGLFIAHQNIQDHGGSIEVKSRGEKGTTFILTLPHSHS